MTNPVYTYIKYKIYKYFVRNILKKPELICLHSIYSFQVSLFNTNNFI